MKRLVIILAASALVAMGIAAGISMATPPAGGPPGQGECEHGNSGQECRPDPQPTHGQDCDEHGQQGGVNEDHCLPPTTTEPPPTTTEPPPTTTEPPPTTTTPTTPPPTNPPPGHNCPFVGADKDGGKDKFGGTNDDCAPRPDPPAAAVPTPAPSPVTAQQTTTPTATTPAAPAAGAPKAKPKPKAAPKRAPTTKQTPKAHAKPKAKKKTCPANTRLFQGKCHPIVQGNG